VCIKCLLGNKEMTMRETRPGTFNGILTVLAGLLLSLLLAGSAWALTATDCATCHGADVIEGHHDTTDPNSLFNQGLCSTCHVGITTSGDCTTCHAATGLNNKHHIPPAGQTSIDCAQCHTGAGDPQNCSGCHQGEVPRNFHHTQLTAPIYYVNGKLNCAGCHPGTTLTSNCQACHNATTGADPRTQHHSYTDTAGNKPACTSCHAQLKTISGCQDCHAPGTKLTEHHAMAAAPANLSCGMCHSNLPLGVGLPSGSDLSGTAGCKDCHTSANLPLHHDTVRAEKNLTCGQCHSNAVAVSGCEGCHFNGTTPDTRAIHHGSDSYASGNCGSCHTSSGLADAGCVSCHSFSESNQHHDAAYIYGKYAPSIDGCTDCHVRGTYQIAPENCIFCHEGIVNTPDIQPKHHLTSPATSGDCAACHTGMTNPVGTCATCHSSTGPKPATTQIHHAAAAANNKPCADCHTGISKPTTCAAASCHSNASSGTPSSRHHLMKDNLGSSYSCNTCHSGSSQIYQSCRSCHEDLNEGATPAQYHHMTTVYTTGPCATCHQTTDGTPLQKDCAVCHLGAGKPSTATQHHATDSYLTGRCSDCHSSTAPAAIPCAGCHSSTASTHHSQTVTVGTTVTPKPCRDCHSTIQLVGGSCEGCHTAPIPQLHHGDPLTAVNGNCAVCHQSVSSPGSCSTCHTTTSHHTTTWSQTGDCAHCHLVPASATDRPVQAACRECHGSTMHAKGGPIQNYGACAACHSTTPFHAYNGSDTSSSWGGSRDDRSRGGSGPGYNKFNMFSRQNSSRGEEGRDAPRNKLTFSTKSISHDGKSYTVPYFTGMASANLALNKTASASSAESGYSASLAVDGSTSTRWWKKSTSTQTLTVDLGASKSINKVTVRWYSYYAKAYQVQTATSSTGPWSTAFSTSYGVGGAETRTFTTRTARYVRINCQTASSYNGYSINELEVYAP